MQAGAVSISKTLVVQDKPAPQPVPTLGAWALALLSVVAGLLGLSRAYRFRNRLIP